MQEQDRIIKINIEEEMKSSYIDYSMSVIVARALPDVRDGFKPVHRRILYGMMELGNTSDKPYKKAARIVGEVLGKYHPHGDSSVYGALVRMAQDWAMRYPLVDGQGNFGSIDGDSAAAMRYTEARLKKIGEEMMQDLYKETVDFTNNFDDTLQEPTVMLHNNISVGAVSCDDHQMESIQVGSGTVHLDKHWLLDFTLNMQNSSAGCGIPLHRGHAIARLGNNPCIGVSRLALAIGHALSESCAVDHSDGNLGFVRRRKRFKEFFDTFHRGITPIILLAVGHFECVHIK